jgi:hypothetical protein
MLNPTRHVDTNPKSKYACGEGPSDILKCVLIKFTVFIKEKHTAKSIILEN